MVAVIQRHIPKTTYLGTALLTGFMALSAYANPVSESPRAVESESNESAIAAQTQSEQQAQAQPNPSNIAQASAASPATVIASGTFEGRSGHVTSGGVSIIESGGKYYVQLANDFYLDGAPDPKVGLGYNGYDPATKAGHLISSSGASSYEIPRNIDVQGYNEVYIWCEKFSVPIGMAPLQAQ